MTEHIRVVQRGPILDVEFARREKKNAITAAMYAALTKAFTDAGVDDRVSVVLLHGQADLFTSGNDLADFRTPDARKEGHGHHFLHAIASCQKPIVAAVGGAAIGIGTTMLMHCDLVIASDEARFRLPFVPLGISPEAGSSMLLPLLAGPRLAAELMLLGDFFNAETARQAGIVNRVVPAAELLEVAQGFAERLAAQPAQALQTTKMLLKRPAGRTAIEAIEEERPHFERLLHAPEAQAIFRAFFERP